MPNSIETGRKVVDRLTVPHDRISGGAPVCLILPSAPPQLETAWYKHNTW